MLGVDALVEKPATRSLRWAANRPSPPRLDSLHRRLADDFDIEFARPIGDDFDDLVVVEPLADGPSASLRRPFRRRR